MQQQLGAVDQQQVLDAQLGEHAGPFTARPRWTEIYGEASCISFSRKRR